jgi:hypothetical protein
MEAKFAICADDRRDALLITMSGFFRPSDVEAFTQDLRAARSRLSCLANQHLTLCDVRQMKIQSQEIVAAFAQVVGASGLRSRKLAFVTGSSLARLQAKRLTDREGVRFFSDPNEAEHWLFARPAIELADFRDKVPALDV